MTIVADSPRLISPITRVASRYWANLPVLATTCLALATLGVFGVRLAATVTRGEYCDAVCEAPCVYNVWKVQNGQPLYEWPIREPYSLTFYNVAFYHSYARVLQAFGVGGSDIILGGRLLTVLWGLLGALVSYRLTAALAEPAAWTPVARWLAACYSVFLWFGSSATAWFALSVRPDVPSFVLALAGLLVYARWGPTRPWTGCLAAALLFYLAWAFKQSTVGLLAGTCLHAFFCGRRKGPALALALSCAALMACTLWWGGETYRFNVLKVPRLAPIDLHSGKPGYLLQSLVTNAFVWLFPAACLLVRVLPGRAAGDAPGLRSYLGSRIAVIALPSATAVAWCVFAVFREGADKNTLLEGYIGLGTCSLVLLINRLGRPGQPASAWNAGLLGFGILAMAAFPLVQLAFPDRLGNLTIATPSEHEKAATFAAYLHRLPRPLLVEDGFYAQPWHATDGCYPAYVPDVHWYCMAKARGWMTDGGLEKLVRQRKFRCLLLGRNLVSPSMASEAGYQPASFPPGVDSQGFALYVLPDVSVAAPETGPAP
jgi:hypothetical protein